MICRSQNALKGETKFQDRMTSSNGESTSKIARMDDVMVASMKEELEKERKAMKSSMKKREEAATKRRQVSGRFKTYMLALLH